MTKQRRFLLFSSLQEKNTFLSLTLFPCALIEKKMAIEIRKCEQNKQLIGSILVFVLFVCFVFILAEIS